MIFLRDPVGRRFLTFQDQKFMPQKVLIDVENTSKMGRRKQQGELRLVEEEQTLLPFQRRPQLASQRAGGRGKGEHKKKKECGRGEDGKHADQKEREKERIYGTRFRNLTLASPDSATAYYNLL